jgi:hypothetical protein
VTGEGAPTTVRGRSNGLEKEEVVSACRGSRTPGLLRLHLGMAEVAVGGATC